MKTKNDVRLAYKRDTGENAKIEIEFSDPDFDKMDEAAEDIEYLIIDAKDRMRLNKVLNAARKAAWDVQSDAEDPDLDSIKYIEWLEEQVIKLSKKPDPIRACLTCMHSHTITNLAAFTCAQEPKSLFKLKEYAKHICNKYER